MNWFKNIFVLTLEKDIDKNLLSNLKEITPIPASAVEHKGWANDYNDSQHLYSEINGCYFIQLQKQKKQIPSSLIKKKLDARVAELKLEGQEKIDKKSLKLDIISVLARDAYVNSKNITAYIDNKNKIIVIDTSSPTIVDEFIALLRKDIGELKISIVQPDYNISELLTRWVSNKSAVEPFGLGNSTVLTEFDTGSQSTYKNQDLTSDEVLGNIDQGKLVTQLDLNWHERFTFSYSSDFKLSKIKASSIIKDLVDENLGDSSELTKEDRDIEANIVSMTLMTSDFKQLFDDILKLGS
jgi:recombination associated protein RdgC